MQMIDGFLMRVKFTSVCCFNILPTNLERINESGVYGVCIFWQIECFLFREFIWWGQTSEFIAIEVFQLRG